MSFASTYNNGNANFGVNTDGFTFVKLSEIYNSPTVGGKDVIHAINGAFIHKSKMGVAPVIIDAETKHLVNVPTHMTATFEAILADETAIADIQHGKVGYTIYPYESHGKVCYGIRFIDLTGD